jgi:hypothetical protein
VKVNDTPRLLEMAFHFFTHARLPELAIDEIIDSLADEGNEGGLSHGCGGNESLQHLDLPGLEPEFLTPCRSAARSSHPESSSYGRYCTAKIRRFAKPRQPTKDCINNDLM